MATKSKNKKRMAVTLSGGKAPSGYTNYTEKDIHKATYELMRKNGEGITHEQLTNAVNTYWSVIQDAVKAGKNVQVYGICSIRKTAGRTYSAKAPSNGKTYKGTTKGSIKFIASDAIKVYCGVKKGKEE